MSSTQQNDQNQPEVHHEVESAPVQPVGAVPVKVAVPGTKPVITYILLGVTIIVYILQFVSESMLGLDYPAALGMKINEYIVYGQYWRLITPVFFHGSPTHIAFNMYALYIFGRNLERHYGHFRFTVLYFLSAFAGNIMSFYLSPKPSLGASTAIFGLVAAQGVFIFRNRFVYGSQATRALLNIVTIVVLNLVLGLSPGIDNWGHLGGLLGGLAYAWFAGSVLRLEKGEFIYQVVDTTRTSTTYKVLFIEFTVLVVLAVMRLITLSA